MTEIESLRQQLASASDEIERLKGDKYVQFGTNSNHAKPEQQRELAGTLEMGQLLGGGSHETAGNSKAERKVTLIDDFRGDLNQLVSSATALIELDIAGALVPHGIGGHAKGLLSALCIRVQALRQQLASCQAALADTEALEIGTGERLAKVEQQLAAALAACKVKDEAIKQALGFTGSSCIDRELNKALAIQPDDSALKAWLGEPVAWLEGNPEGLWFVAYSKNDKAPQKPLYSPKGLK